MMPTSIETADAARAWARRGLLGYATEAYSLFTAASDVDAKVRRTLEAVETMAARVRRTFGVDLRGLRMLDVGPDGHLGMMRCLGRDNDVIGVDDAQLPEDPSLRDYVGLLMSASPARVAKNVVRRASGLDRRFLLSLSDRLGKTSFPPPRVLRMDPTQMTLASGELDLVYACSTFAHFPRPAAVLEEMRRVLAPGGIAYVSLRLWTSHAGQLDPRLLLEARPVPPFWPHLRPGYESTVVPDLGLNKIRLVDWERMFTETMPGVRFAHERQDRELAAPLRGLRALGELTAYSDDELLTANVVALWRKPSVEG